MKTIAVDLDDVIGNENDAIRLFINEHYGFDHTAEDYLIPGDYHSYWERIWDVDQETGAQMYRAYVEANHKYEHVPVAGAIEAIRHLKQDYNFVLVTMRGDNHVEGTHRWLSKHLPDVFKSVVFVPLWDSERLVSKGEIARSLKADYLIDDSVEHCNGASEAGIQGLLFGEYGWNKEASVAKDVIRVKDWAAVEEYFDRQR